MACSRATERPGLAALVELLEKATWRLAWEAIQQAQRATLPLARIGLRG